MVTPSPSLPADLDASTWESVEPYFAELRARPVETPAELERWILDRSELDAACSEARANLYIAMSCDTEDAAKSAAYTRYVEMVQPRLKPASFELDKRQVALAKSVGFGKSAGRYAVLQRARAAEVGIFRDKNVPIQTELAKLAQEFDQIAGRQSVVFEGREQTLPQMARYLEQTDRAVREAAWRAVAECRLRDREALDTLYDGMIQRRHRMARNAGFDDFIGYAFKEKLRFDYTPADCRDFWRSVERRVVPLVERIDNRRRRALGVDALRPWDLAVDPRGRPPLRPFDGGHDLVERSIAVLERLDGRLAAMLRDLAGGDPKQPAPAPGEPLRTESLDLDSRKGKRPGGYQYVRDRSRRPFIFMNAAGLHRDAMTMLHEAGHAFHSMKCEDEPIVDYRHSPLEFAEVASMSMEHLTMGHWGGGGGGGGEPGFYPRADEHARARRTHLEDVICLLPWIAAIDAFQHWIYGNPVHTRAQRDAYWLEIESRLGRRVHWEGLEDFHAAQWQRQSHLFGNALYYIEYGIAQLGALQLWLRARREGDKAAVDAYLSALSLGGSRPLPELFGAAGLRFDFGEETIARVVDAVDEELQRLPE